MGDPFMRAFYVVHDQESQRIGVAGRNIDLGPGAVPSRDIYQGTAGTKAANSTDGQSSDIFSGYIVYVIVSVGSTLVILLLVCIICRLRRRNRDKPKA